MRKLVVVTLSICFALLSRSTTFAYQDGDWQLWNSGSLQGNLAENLKARWEQQIRFGDRMGELYFCSTDIGLTCKVTHWFCLGVNYWQVYAKKSGKWEVEKRPHINGTLKWKGKSLELENRNRLEYRIPEGADNIWKYRNRLTLTIPAMWTKLKIQPYVADETFVDLDKGEFDRNRLSGGFKALLTDYLGADIYYFWQASQRGEYWIDHNVLGAKLKVII